MIYSKIDVTEESKAIICPNCENEQIPDGDFCQVCGKHIVNRCVNQDYPGRYPEDEPCGKLLSGDARYCTFCGAESTFKQNGYLNDWQDERERELYLNGKI